MRRADSAAPFVPPAPAARCEWCGLESADGVQALVSVCKGCGRASSSRTMRAVSSAPTRRYPAFKPVPEGTPPATFDELDEFSGPSFGPSKNGALPPALPNSSLRSVPRPLPTPLGGMKAVKQPPPLPPSAKMAIGIPVASIMIDTKVSVMSDRPESDSALTIPVPARPGPPRPSPSRAPGPNPLSIIPLAKAQEPKLEPVQADELAVADTKMAPSYKLPAISISPIISIPPPPVMIPAIGSLPTISIFPRSPSILVVDDAYAPEPMEAANDFPIAGPPPLPTFVGLPAETPAHLMSAASAKMTARSAPAVLAAPLPNVSGPLAGHKVAAAEPPPSLRMQLETAKNASSKMGVVRSRMLPFVLGGIAVGALVAAGIVAKTHAFKHPKPASSSSVATPAPSMTAAKLATSAVSEPLATAAVVTHPAVDPVASASASVAPTSPRPTAEPTALAAPAAPATGTPATGTPAALTTVVTTEAAPTPPAPAAGGSFGSAGTLDDARSAQKAGDLAKASAIYNRLAQNPDTQLDAFMGLGDMARSSGDLGAAKSAYIKALNVAPGYLPAALAAADAAWDQGSIEEARARYHRIKERYPVRMLPARVKERSSVGDK